MYNEYGDNSATSALHLYGFAPSSLSLPGAKIPIVHDFGSFSNMTTASLI